MGYTHSNYNDIVNSLSSVDFTLYEKVSLIAVSSGCDAVLKSLCSVYCENVQVILVAPVVNLDGYQLDKMSQCMESLVSSFSIVCNKNDAYSLKDALSLVGFFKGYRIDTHHAIEVTT